MFMPPSSPSIFLSLFFSSLHFSPTLTPPVNYLLSVQLGQELHFLPDGSLWKKKEKKMQFGVCSTTNMLERERAEKLLIK